MQAHFSEDGLEIVRDKGWPILEILEKNKDII